VSSDDSKRAETEPAAEALKTKSGKPLSHSRIDTLSTEFVARLLSGRRHEIGEVLAERFRILRDLDDGGMGQVFVAENLSIGREVAIKVLKPDLLANEEFRKRFQKEAEAIAAIQHQNVVRFLDLVVGDPTFLVMEYVDGPTLTKVLHKEQRLDPARAAELARHLCWGLDAAHRVGVIHRDVKPSNIVLALDAEHGELPKLIDFGVAKLPAKGPELQLTRHGQILGTPYYMCPEQITGGNVDARSDVYSLGCVLYHMVTGRPPFVGVEEYDIITQHVQRPPAPLWNHVAGVPSELERVVQRALAKEPSSRFDSMQEMARALAAIPRPGKPAPRPEDSPTPTSLKRMPSRYRPIRPVLRWALGFGMLLLAAGGVTAGWALRGRTLSGGGGLLLATDPAGATVEVDGRRMAETTPTAVRGLAAGPHLVRLHLDGHGDVERQVTVRAGERALVEVVLGARSHRVDVKSAPSGATVFLDGKLVAGTTPTVMTVTDDDFHELRVERVGYEVLTSFLKPEDRQPSLELTLEPEKEPRGVISIDGPSGAEVWLDGAYTGFSTPTLGMRIPVGDHAVELRSGNLRSSPARVAVHQGESVHLLLTLVDREAR
jgi:predicted Ser/Thr protein kinase